VFKHDSAVCFPGTLGTHENWGTQLSVVHCDVEQVQLDGQHVWPAAHWNGSSLHWTAWLELEHATKTPMAAMPAPAATASQSLEKEPMPITPWKP
jgi:hypothetical protein